MSYKVQKRKGERPYKIIDKKTRRIVGTSKFKNKALRSIEYREQAENNSA